MTQPTLGFEPHLYLVVPAYNRCELTRRCMASIFAQDSGEFTVVVVDDGSTDGTGQMLSNEFPQVVVVQGDGNLWWTGATRKGVDYVLEHCDAHDAVVLLNDDTLIETDYLRHLREAAKRHPDSLVGSVVLDSTRRNQITDGGSLINWHNAKWQRLNAGRLLGQAGTQFEGEVSTLTGRGVYIPLEAFDSIGLYNNNRFPQHGDTELPIRANRAGYRLIVSYRCQVFCRHDLAGDINERKKYRLSQLWNMVTNPRSYFNMRERFWFAWHTRQNWPQFVTFWICDTIRVSVHLIARLVR